MFTIKINKLKLFGYHGVYKEEGIVGGQFELNVEVSYYEDGFVYELHETINYVNIIEIIKKQFAIKSDRSEERRVGKEC